MGSQPFLDAYVRDYLADRTAEARQAALVAHARRAAFAAQAGQATIARRPLPLQRSVGRALAAVAAVFAR